MRSALLILVILTATVACKPTPGIDCDQFSESVSPNECSQLIDRCQNSDSAYCNEMMSNLHTKYAQVSGNHKHCEGLAEPSRSKCFHAAAIGARDASICDNIPYETFEEAQQFKVTKDYCIGTTPAFLKDIDISDVPTMYREEAESCFSEERDFKKGLEWDDFTNCVSRIIFNNPTIEGCDFLKKTENDDYRYAFMCFLNLPVEDQKIYCPHIDDRYFGYSCYYMLVNITGDKQFCQHIAQDFIKAGEITARSALHNKYIAQSYAIIPPFI